jgi:hypothetical protein
VTDGDEEGASSVNEPEYCELHDWKQIATITTGNGMFAIVPPYYGNTLGKWWDRVFLPRNEEVRKGRRPRLTSQFEEVELRQKTWSVTNPKGYKDMESALVFDAPGNGGYAVDARFCDLYGDGHMSICELRIRLHAHDEDDDDADDDEAAPAA